jgi:DNA-binding transcriptional LysR family regulator
VQLWQRARLQVAVPPGHRATLTIGSEVPYGSRFCSIGCFWMRGSQRDIALRVHVDVPQDLINLVAGGIVDAAIMYAPQHRPGLAIDQLMEENLVLVTSNLEECSPKTDYVHVD